MRLAVTAAVLAAALGLARPQCFSGRDDFSVKINKDISGITDFGLELYRQLAPPGSPENFFFSPFSIWMAFVLAYFGTGGETAAQLQRALRVGDQVATLKLWRELEALYERRQAEHHRLHLQHRQPPVRRQKSAGPAVRRRTAAHRAPEDRLQGREDIT
nr:uncharacterized protein LOC113815708 isoform X2 [Penaeus vannamei]XP_027223531.1 uncharacterized protein LOC113815708 isoform X2 [Penaeus vannamei]